MILSVGLDLVEVSRIAAAMKNPAFLERILTAREREVITSPMRVAGRWAAKEAIAKAVGLHLSWQDVEVLPGPSGEPIVTIHHSDFDVTSRKIHISITHERGHAAAVAVLEGL
ncbi:MAG: holo-[acyl-carrier-protein] synthase [Armatimonadetes bacterium 55-13]|mgnify:CR=1 FL=1|nr:holo-ACP synthase [Armatimonadota bacterium]OJU62700.1 MAG: holo-[acyl-carrier-protein] synthase [Armatimonadetes bacterium 55-13]